MAELRFSFGFTIEKAAKMMQSAKTTVDHSYP
jgi:hypothetical protein